MLDGYVSCMNDHANLWCHASAVSAITVTYILSRTVDQSDAIKQAPKHVHWYARPLQVQLTLT